MIFMTFLILRTKFAWLNDISIVVFVRYWLFQAKILMWKYNPPQFILDNLILEYVYYHEGVVEGAARPHSHLWDRLRYATILLTDDEKRIYIFSRKMRWDLWCDFCCEPELARFHAHGLPGQGPEDEVANICFWFEHDYPIVFKRLIFASFACLAMSLLLFLVGL